MRRTSWMLVVGIVGSLTGGCATQHGWNLVHPPESADAAAPGGGRLFPRAPIADWRVAATFRSEAACEAAMDSSLNENLDRAHAVAGEDAKYDLGVRRAVNARCVRAAER